MNPTIATFHSKQFTPGDEVTVTDLPGTGTVVKVAKSLLWVQYPNAVLAEVVLRLNAQPVKAVQR